MRVHDAMSTLTPHEELAAAFGVFVVADGVSYAVLERCPPFRGLGEENLGEVVKNWRGEAVLVQDICTEFAGGHFSACFLYLESLKE